MGRRPKAAADTTETQAADTAATDTAGTETAIEASTGETGEGGRVIRRRRRKRVVDHAEQTRVLVSSVLAARGGSGANLDELQKVIFWARSVHADTAEAATLKTRVRSARSESGALRITAAEVNKSLLDGVMEGRLLVDVSPAGEVIFSRKGHIEGNG